MSKNLKINEKTQSFLEDFNKFIEYVVENQVTVSNKNKFISPKHLFEINKLMKEQAENVTERNTQLYYPLLHLFTNIAMASKLFVEEPIKGSKILLKPTEKIEKFQGLNDTEKFIYFLEVLWVDCDFEKLRYQTYDHLTVVHIHELLKRIAEEEANKIISFDYYISFFSTMLLYFKFLGLLEVKSVDTIYKEPKVREFIPKEIMINPLGIEIIKVLASERTLEPWNIPDRRELGYWKEAFKEDFYLPFKKLFEPGELEKTLPRQSHEFNNGVYIFKVLLTRGKWGKLQLSAHNTLEDLHNLIQKAFDFDNDHLYSFFMDGIPWSNYRFSCPYDDEGPYTDEAKIGDLGLVENQRFLYLFDYGHEWRFEVQVESITKSEKVAALPQIIEFKGRKPSQY